MPYNDMPELLGRPELRVNTIRKSVSRFWQERKKRGRPVGWKKTTDDQDNVIFKTFHRVRKPLGSLCESMDVWTALPKPLREKVFATHTSRRLYRHVCSTFLSIALCIHNAAEDSRLVDNTKRALQ